MDWKVQITKLDNLTNAEKQLITQQEKVWKALLGLLPENTYLYNPNMEESILNAIKKSEVSMDRFININYKASHGVASVEEIVELQRIVTKYFPKPKVNDILRKVITEKDFVKYYKNIKKPKMARGAGFITKAEDYKIPNSSKELIENLRLDYQGTKFSKEKGFVVIEYKNQSPNVEHPFNTNQSNSKLPYTNTGMTGSKHNIIPEYYSSDIIEFEIGDVLRVYDKNGKITEIYKIVKDDITKEKVWKKQ